MDIQKSTVRDEQIMRPTCRLKQRLLGFEPMTQQYQYEVIQLWESEDGLRHEWRLLPIEGVTDSSAERPE